MTASAAKPVVLCKRTAALFWRAVREGRIEAPEPCEMPYPFSSASGYRDLASIDLSSLGLTLTNCGALSLCNQRWITVQEGSRTHQELIYAPSGIALPPGTLIPLDILVCTKNQSRNSPVVAPHVLSNAVPPHSFCKVAERIFVTSALLTYVQSCLTKRTLPNIELGLEWCGSYALSAPSCPHVDHADQLFSADELRAYVDSIHHLSGVGAARESSAWLADGLASPRETEVYLLLVLPPSLGGFGFTKPLVNEPIPLKGALAKSMTSDPFYIVDLLYRRGSTGVVIEYDGKDDHESTAEEVIRDKERRSVLAALGYTVIVITRRDLSNLRRLRQKGAQIARAIGEELPDETSVEARLAQSNLIRWLLNPSHDHLPFGFGYY